MVRNPRKRNPIFRWLVRGLGLGVVVAGVAFVGVKLYPRYFGGEKVCLLPTPAPGPRITITTSTSPMPVIYGKIATLEVATNPIRYRVLPTEVEMRDVYYEGTVVGPAAVPQKGAFRILKVGEKYIPLRDNDIADGCVNLRGAGKTILLFSNSFSPTLTLVLTPDQKATLGL